MTSKTKRQKKRKEKKISDNNEGSRCDVGGKKEKKEKNIFVALKMY